MRRARPQVKARRLIAGRRLVRVAKSEPRWEQVARVWLDARAKLDHDLRVPSQRHRVRAGTPAHPIEEDHDSLTASCPESRHRSGREWLAPKREELTERRNADQTSGRDSNEPGWLSRPQRVRASPAAHEHTGTSQRRSHPDARRDDDAEAGGKNLHMGSVLVRWPPAAAKRAHCRSRPNRRISQRLRPEARSAAGRTGAGQVESNARRSPVMVVMAQMRRRRRSPASGACEPECEADNEAAEEGMPERGESHCGEVLAASPRRAYCQPPSPYPPLCPSLYPPLYPLPVAEFVVAGADAVT